MSLVQIGSLIIHLESVEIIPTKKRDGSKYELVVNNNNNWTFGSDTDEGKALVKWLAAHVKVVAPHELTEEVRPRPGIMSIDDED